MEEKPITSSEESLQIIGDMIKEVKRDIAEGSSFYFLLWGTVVAVGNFGSYLLDQMTTFQYPFVVWFLVVPGWFISMWYGYKSPKQVKVRSHYGRLCMHVWIAVSIGILLSLIFMVKLGYNHNAVILMLAGIGTYLTGQLIKFKPLTWGAMVLFSSCVVAMMLDPIDQFLVTGVGIVLGYLVPGLMLRKQENE